MLAKLSLQGGRSEQEVKGFRQEGEEKEKRSWRRTIGAGRFLKGAGIRCVHKLRKMVAVPQGEVNTEDVRRCGGEQGSGPQPGAGGAPCSCIRMRPGPGQWDGEEEPL